MPASSMIIPLHRRIILVFFIQCNAASVFPSLVRFWVSNFFFGVTPSA
jgi:hypothetical protein